MQQFIKDLVDALRFVGQRYAVIILVEIMLSIGVLVTIFSFMVGYEKEFLTKIIGTTPHISAHYQSVKSQQEIKDVESKMQGFGDIERLSRGLVYTGTAQLYERQFDDDWNVNKINSQSPEIIIKGLDYTEEVELYYKKALISFQSFDTVEEENEHIDKIVSRIFPGQRSEGEELNTVLKIGKQIAVPPSIYRDLLIMGDTGFVMVDLLEGSKNFGSDYQPVEDGIEFNIVSAVDTPVSSDNIQILTSHEVLQYTIYGQVQEPKPYNYIEMNFTDPMVAKALIEDDDFKNKFGSDVEITSWTEVLASELAVVSSFYLLFYSILLAVGLAIGLLISSLLDITVRRKKRQISVMTAFGAPKAYILKIFFRYSLFLGFLGTILGYLFSFGLIRGFYSFKELEITEDMSPFKVLILEKVQLIPEPIMLSGEWMMGLTVFLMFISALAAYAPANAAASIDPISGLKED